MVLQNLKGNRKEKLSPLLFESLFNPYLEYVCSNYYVLKEDTIIISTVRRKKKKKKKNSFSLTVPPSSY